MKYIAAKSITLLEALQEMYPDSSKSKLREMLKHHRIHVDNSTIVNGNFCLQIGQSVCINTVRKMISKGVELIYKDRDIIVVNKPAKMLSVPLDTEDSFHLLGILRHHFHNKNIYAVHRLDKEASGVLVFANGKQSVDPLNNMFKEHLLKRIYVAVVQGNIKEDEGTWISSLQELKNCDVRSAPHIPDGKNAITHYSVFYRSKNFSFLKITLETGRKHQIRVHCKDAGHPIVGDKRYGDTSCNPISRMCLHASLLEFAHPMTGKAMSFSAPIPAAFARLGLIPSGQHFGDVSQDNNR